MNNIPSFDPSKMDPKTPHGNVAAHSAAFSIPDESTSNSDAQYDGWL